MVRGRIRGWWPLAAVASFVVAAFWLLYVVWRSPHRSDLATYGAFALPVVTLMMGWMAWAWRARTRRADPPAAGQDLDRVAGLLAMAVKTQWERAAGERGLTAAPIPVTWGRPSLPMAGPTAAAASSRRFASLPGLTPVREALLAAGRIDDLHAVYGGLRSGRLVIAGAPGSGKSGTAVLLVLSALRHRDRVRAEDRVKVPVPVLFTAQDWDPRRQPVAEWLTGRLQQTYSLFAGRTGVATAVDLINAGKITVILDGLDEIAADLRPVALQGLDQASFRVVVLSRTAEMASAATQHGVLQGAAAVELRVIDPATAAGYLERVQLDPAPDGWQDLINRIRANPVSPLTEALNNPLALTLIRDTYQSGDDARELVDYCDTIQKQVSSANAVKEITGYLLDRVLPAAYAPRSGQPPPRYDLETAQNALAKIATRMDKDGTYDLRWWHIPQWAPSAPRIFAGGLVTWLVVEVVLGIVSGAVSGLESWGISAAKAGVEGGLLVGLAAGIAAGITAGVAARGTSGPPARIGRIGKPRLRRALTRRSLSFGLRNGLIAGLLSGFAVGIGAGLVIGLGNGLASGLVAGVVAGPVAGLLIGIMFGLVAWIAAGLANTFIDPDNTSSSSPASSWRDDRRHAMAIGLVVGVVIGAAIGIVYGFGSGAATGLVLGLVLGIGTALMAGLGISHAWPATLTAAQLARRWHTPLQLMNFLNDAHERNILRTVGSAYQFRHASLQDRLACGRQGGLPGTEGSAAAAWDGG